MFGVLDGAVVVVRFEDQIIGSGLFCKYLISWVEIQQVQCTLAIEKNLNLDPTHLKKKLLATEDPVLFCTIPP
jgi:hypothetical protein